MVMRESASSQKGWRVLIVTTSCGGGHWQAANAKEADILHRNPRAVVIKKDIAFTPCKSVGRAVTFFWHLLQTKGWVRGLHFAVDKLLFPFDILFYPVHFAWMSRILTRYDIDEIFDTQPLGLSGFLAAIRWVSRRKKKQIPFNKIITEFPSDSLYFFSPIKKLSKRQSRLVNLVTVPPLIRSPHHTEAMFWEKACRLPMSAVRYEALPIRRGFVPYQRRIRRHDEEIKVQIRYNHWEEKRLAIRAVERGDYGQVRWEHNQLFLRIAPEHKVSTLLLGSQPTNRAVLEYVKNFLTMAQQALTIDHPPYLLFVFCKTHRDGKNRLLEQICDLIQLAPCCAARLTIVPMSFQNDETIAALFYRSDATITRSGGITAMELLSVVQGQIWIHSEVKEGVREEEALVRGMPMWESYNALYLKKKKGARFITPALFPEQFSSFFSLTEGAARIDEQPCGTLSSLLCANRLMNNIPKFSP